MIRATSSRRPASNAWKMALCSESIGKRRTPCVADRIHDQPSGHDQGFLVGEPHILTRAMAASAGRRPTAPTTAETTISAEGRVAITVALGTGDFSPVAIGQQGGQGGPSGRVADGHHLRLEFPTCSASSSMRRPADSPATRNRSGN
jgi:hypothetical protein